MSETEADREYFAAAEAAFIRRRGTPFLLSPRDFAFLKEWRALGVPIEAIEHGIDDAFTHREERGAIGRVNSLSYCRDAVLAAWERQSEAAIGKGRGRGEAAVDAGPTLTALASALGRIAETRPDLAAPLESARRSLVRLGTSRKEPSAIEESLARLDKRLAGALLEALSETERARIDEEVTAQLAHARVRMDDETAEKTARALRRRSVRELLELPRLTIL